MRAALFGKTAHHGYSQLRIPAADIKATIFSHSEFTAFNESATKFFARWQKSVTPQLNGLKAGSHPKALIEIISEDLLETFLKAPLLDPYDVYQHLMDYWQESMQDDCYLIAAVQGELDRVSQTLTGRIRLLADRYAAPLPQIVDEVEQPAAKVAAHLQKMGAY